MHPRDLSDIPDEIMLEIFKYLDKRESLRVSLVDKRFDAIWKDKALKWNLEVKHSFPIFYNTFIDKIRSKIYAHLIKKEINITDIAIDRTLQIALTKVDWKKLHDKLRNEAYVVNDALRHAFECVRNNDQERFLSIPLNYDMINTSDNTGETLLSLCRHRQEPHLLSHIYRCLLAESDPRTTPLHLAIECQQNNEIARLIAEGQHLNDPGMYLRIALENESEFALTQLLGNDNALIETRDFDGFTPLCKAALEGKEKLVAELIRRGADITASDTDNAGTNVLGNAICHPSILQSLVLNHHADVNAYSADGFSSLHHAINFYTTLNDDQIILKYNLLQNIRFLLEHGADPRLMTRDDAPTTALEMAKIHLPRELYDRLVEAARNLEMTENTETYNDSGNKRKLQ